MSQTFGKTRWKRFALVMVPTIGATAAVGISMAQGALAASFAVSGVHATITAGQLTGKDFTQYGSVDAVGTEGKYEPVAVSGFSSADITDMCQSVVIPLPKLPGLPASVTMKITGGDAGTPVHAENIYLDMTDLSAQNAQFTNINIGEAAGALAAAGKPIDKTSLSSPGFADSFAQGADSATLTGVTQTSYATQASSFSLAHMGLHLSSGSNPCTLNN